MLILLRYFVQLVLHALQVLYLVLNAGKFALLVEQEGGV